MTPPRTIIGKKPDDDRSRPFLPIRKAVFRGLGVVLPPLLTIVIFLWVLGTIDQYVFEPLTAAARSLIVWGIEDIRSEEDIPPEMRGKLEASIEGVLYQRVGEGNEGAYLRKSIYLAVRNDPRVESMPQTATETYRRYVDLYYLQPYQVIPYFLCGFTIILYLLGKFMAAGVGRFFWGTFERGINRVPLVSNVYSSVKQVSDFVLSERKIEASRVVAVEWPRKGIWCLALVTGPSLKEIQSAAGEEVLSVLVCTSPMPATGFTVTVRKKETVDLGISIDQAIQFIVSCGVVVPPDQLSQMQSQGQTPAEQLAADDSTAPPAAEDSLGG